MKRRRFLEILAGGLVLPMEMFRGRSQVAVGDIWTPQWVTVRDERVNPFCADIDRDRSFEEDLEYGFKYIEAHMGYMPKTV